MGGSAADASGGQYRTLERIGAVLDAVENHPLSASEIAKATELSASTTYRLVGAMADHGFLRKRSDGTFTVGPRLVRNALAVVAAPHVEALRDATGETVQLWVRDGADRVCRVSADSLHELRATLPEGTRIPLPQGSAGLILSEESEARSSLTAHGWVESVGRRTPGLASVSAPVVVGARLVGALCLALPTSRIEVSPGADHGPALLATAAGIVRSLTDGSVSAPS